MNQDTKGGKAKEALKRDWEQTKHDISKKHGEELDQDVGDTLKQAAGKQEVPPRGVPNYDKNPTRR